MKQSRKSVPFAVALLVVLAAGCAPAPAPVPTSTPPQPTALPTQTALPTNTPVPTVRPTSTWVPAKPSLTDYLITAEDLEELSADLGVVNWKLDEEQAGQYCREFTGEGDMMTRIPAGNCILEAGNQTLPEIVAYFNETGAIKPAAVEIESKYEYEDDFALYRNFDESIGYAVYDAVVLREGVLYWAWIDFATGVFSRESLFEDYGDAIDTFLHEILMRNFGEST